MASSILTAALLTLGLATAAVAEPGQKVAPSGSELFAEHCATCHGSEGIGNGPMAGLLTLRPADLTMITARANGTFPAARIVEVIRYGGNVQGHGSSPMPIWGRVFSDEGGRGRLGGIYSRQAVVELKKYLEGIQRQPAGLQAPSPAREK
jgi:mono/diheme cytochrome c family protein